ncbi:MAG TPA: S8 family serine peptidase [Pseudobacteroides sp.]|uniref:S8 family serine peptidase n=1 Tax=Pseudobacteroides sp. TaxID=1968840 RepID=UPI002F9279DB
MLKRRLISAGVILILAAEMILGSITAYGNQFPLPEKYVKTTLSRSTVYNPLNDPIRKALWESALKEALVTPTPMALPSIPQRNIANVASVQTESNNKQPETISLTDLLEGNKGKDKKEVIVKYKDIDQKENTKKKLKSKKTNLSLKSKSWSKTLKLETIEISDESELNNVIDELKKDPNVEYAQPNYKLELMSEPSDDRFIEEWGLKNSGQTVSGQAGTVGVDTNAIKAWNITKGSDTVKVAIIDTGIDIKHPDLAASIYKNPNERPNGLDNDGNGYVNDVNGWNFVDDTNSVFTSEAEDTHGTHIAGIISAGINDGGVVGLAPNVKIVPLKFISGNIGYTSDAIRAIEYCQKAGIEIANISWGGSDYNNALMEAMKNSSTTFICASGNAGKNIDSSLVYPAAFDLPNIIAVSANDNKGQLASFSNYGTKVDISAPGVNILSTLPGNKYGYMSGTSMAAPFVTGTVALLKSIDSTLNAVEIKERVLNNTTKSDSLSGKVATSGRLNAYAALVNSVPEYESTPLPTGTPTPQMPTEKSKEPQSIYDGSLAGNGKIEKPLKEKTNLFIDSLINKGTSSTSNENGIKNLTINKLKGNFVAVTWTTDVESDSVLLYGADSSLANKISYPELTTKHQITLKLDNIQSIGFYKVRSNSRDGRVFESGVKEVTSINDLGGENVRHLAVTETVYGSTAQEVNTLSYVTDNGSNHSLVTSQPIGECTVFGIINGTRHDFYSVNLTAGRTYSIKLTGMAEGEDYDIYLMNDVLNDVGYSTNISNYDESITYTATATGTYYIDIQPSTYNTNSAHHNYQLMFYSTEKAPDSFEPNDSKETATAVSDSTLIRPTLNINTDEDWFVLDTIKTGKLDITMKSIPSGCDYDIQVYDTNGTVLGGSYSGGNQDEKIDSIVTLPGKYFVRVYSYTGSNSTDTYELKAGVYTPDQYEVNDDIYNVNSQNKPAMSLNSYIYGTMDNQDDVDCFRFTLEGSTKAGIRLNNIPDGTDYDMVVYSYTNGDFIEVGRSTNGGKMDEEIVSQLIEGNYIVKVYSYWGSSESQTYKLSLYDETTGLVSMEADKTTADVGDVITVTIKANGITNIAGYQANVKYDPAVLMPVNLDDTQIDSSTYPMFGDILVNPGFSPFASAMNNLNSGILNFGTCYINIDGYRSGGVAEKSGTLATLRFKVLKANQIIIQFERTESMINSPYGITCYDWYGNEISCNVSKAIHINEELPVNDQTVTSSNTETEVTDSSLNVIYSETLNQFTLSGYIVPDFISSLESIDEGFKVEILGTTFSDETNEDGYFVLSGSLPDGQYTLQVTKSGYLKRKINDLTLKGKLEIGTTESPIKMWAGDIPKDNIQDDSINMSDVIQIAMSFGKVAEEENSGFNTNCDLNADGSINMSDVIIMAKHFNATPSSYDKVTVIVSEDIKLFPPKNLISLWNTGASISLTWSQPSAGDMPDNYEVYCNDRLIASTKGTSITCMGLTPNALNKVYVKAVDLAGNKSDSSNILEIQAQEDDHGNTKENATPIELGKEVSGVFHDSNDYDYFKFTPKTTGIYVIKIYRSNYTPEFYNNEGYPAGSGTNNDYHFEAGKVYYLRTGTDNNRDYRFIVRLKSNKPDLVFGYASGNKCLASIPVNFDHVVMNIGDTASTGSFKVEITVNGQNNKYYAVYTSNIEKDNSVYSASAVDLNGNSWVPSVPGEYDVTFKIDSENNISEANEENNTFTAKYYVDDHGDYASNATEFQICKDVTGTLGATGDSDVFVFTPTKSGKYEFSIKNSPVDFFLVTANMGSIIPTTIYSSEKIFKYDFIAGQKYYILVCDKYEKINTTEQYTIKSYEIAPDLTISKVDIKESQNGEPCKLRAEISNIGNSYLQSGRFRIGFKVENKMQIFYTDYYEGLVSIFSPAELYLDNIQLNEMLKYNGNHNIHAFIEKSSNFNELLEDNNSINTTVSFYSDLTITDIIFPNEPNCVEPIPTKVVVKNIGPKASTIGYPVVVCMDIDGIATKYYSSTYTRQIQPGQSAELAVYDDYGNSPQINEVGIYTAHVKIDEYHDYNDMYEHNNTFSKSLKVGSLPDWIITDVIIEPNEISHSDEVILSAIVKNVGEEIISENKSIRIGFKIDDSDILFWSDVQLNLKSGETIKITANEGVVLGKWNAKEGEHTVFAVVDSLQNAKELDENNNEFSKSVTVKGKCDLKVEQIILDPPNPAAGEKVILKAKIRNTSENPSPATRVHKVEFMIDGDILFSKDISTNLKPGEKVTVTSYIDTVNGRWDAEEGEHTVTGVVDPLESIEEADEYNNTLTRGIIVKGKCEFKLEEIMLDPPNPVVGEKVTLKARLRNISQNASPFGRIHKVGFKIDNSTEIWTESFSGSIGGGEYIILSTDGMNGQLWTPNYARSYNITSVLDGSTSNLNKTVTVTGNRVFDAAADYDNDGLSNGQEINLGTQWDNYDTDGDSICDGDERNGTNGFITDPLNPDTDEDGTNDNFEVKLGNSPVEKDEYVPFSIEAHSQSGSVAVEVFGNSSLQASHFEVNELNSLSRDSIDGIIGNPVDISLNGSNFKEATISFNYDETILNGISEDDLTVYWLDYDNNTLVPLPEYDVSIDKYNNIITARVNHFSTYVPGKKNLSRISYNNSVVFVIDESGSIGSNDITNGIDIPTKIVEKSSENNEFAVVRFSGIARQTIGLSQDKEDIINAIKKVGGTSSTNIQTGLQESKTILSNSSQNRKYVVLLSDGGDSNHSSIINVVKAMVNEEIKILCVSLGGKSPLLSEIASIANGTNYYIDPNNDLNVEISNIVNNIMKEIELVESIPPEKKNPSKKLPPNLPANTPIKLPIHTYGCISYAGEIDAYEFTPDVTKTYCISSMGETDTEINIFDGTGKLISSSDSNDDSEWDKNFYMLMNLTKDQKYRFEVRHSDLLNGTGEYYIHISDPIMQTLSADMAYLELLAYEMDADAYTVNPDESVNVTIGGYTHTFKSEIYRVNGKPAVKIEVFKAAFGMTETYSLPGNKDENVAPGDVERDILPAWMGNDDCDTELNKYNITKIQQVLRHLECWAPGKGKSAYLYDEVYKGSSKLYGNTTAASVKKFQIEFMGRSTNTLLPVYANGAVDLETAIALDEYRFLLCMNKAYIKPKGVNVRAYLENVYKLTAANGYYLSYDGKNIVITDAHDPANRVQKIFIPDLYFCGEEKKCYAKVRNIKVAYKNYKNVIYGSQDVYDTKVNMLKLMGKQMKSGQKFEATDIKNSIGGIDAYWDDKFEKAVNNYVKAALFTDVYNAIKSSDYGSLGNNNVKALFLKHWTSIELQPSLYFVENPAPAKWYTMIPEAPKSDLVNGKTVTITKENKTYSESAKKFYNAYYLPLDKIRNWIGSDDGLRQTWLQATYGITDAELGGVLGGALDQLFDIKGAAKEVVSAIWELLKNPKNTLETVWFLSKVLNPHPLLFIDDKIKFFNLIKDMVATFIDEFKEAGSYEKGRMIGKAISFVLSFFVSGAGIVKATRILDLLRESKALSTVCTKVAKGAVASKEALAKMLEAAAETISKIRTASSDFLNSIKGSIIKLADGYGYRPAYAGMSDLGDKVFEFINKADISDTNKIDNISSTAGRLTNASSIASGTAKHLLNRHSFSRVQNQLKYELKVRPRADIEADLANRNFFNRNWTEDQCLQAAETAFKQAKANNIVSDTFTCNVFGENITVALENGILKTSWGPHKYTLTDFGL